MTDHGLFPAQRRRHRIFGGLNERQEHIFTWIAVVVVLLYVAAWVGAIADAVRQQREIAAEAKQAGLPQPPLHPERFGDLESKSL